MGGNCLSEEKLKTPPHGDKDLGLDVVTWMAFSDKRGAYLHFIGQCATGDDWYSKLHDLKVDWWKEHVGWAVEPVRFFATPIVVPTTKWRRTCLAAGLVLDRPRLIELFFRFSVRARWIAQIKSYCEALYT